MCDPSLACLVDSCRSLERGRSIHETAVRSTGNLCVAGSPIGVHAGSNDALEAFQATQTRTVVSWNALLLELVNNGEGELVLELFSRMEGEGCVPDERSVVSALKACSALALKGGKERAVQRGKALHLQACCHGHDLDIYVQSTLVDMYAKCGSMEEACRVFSGMQHRNFVSWNALLFGYADAGKGEVALSLFSKMDCDPNERTFVAALRACTSVQSLRRGNAVCVLVYVNGYDSNVYVQGTMVDMYARCGSIDSARKVFDKMVQRSVLSWTALILGYAENGQGHMALVLFSRMRSEGHAPNSNTYVAALKACTNLAAEGDDLPFQAKGKALHTLALSDGQGLDNYLKCSLVDMYGRTGSMGDALGVFETMVQPDVVSWTALLRGYADNGKGALVLELFGRMQREGVEPDDFTFATVLKACGMVGALELGRDVHAEIRRQKLENNEVLATCLVDFYAKCGSLVEAEQVFQASPKNQESWNALISGYCRQGNTSRAFLLFERMADSGFRPNDITFLCVLTACSHAGLAEDGKVCFESMLRHGVEPDVAHYTCMIDILARANRLDESMALLRSMPFCANVVSWTAVMGACEKCKNVKLGKLAFESLMSLNEHNAGAYVQMENSIR